ncbi:unnamed protein product, partial [Symbiodinium sp. KB8]
MPLTFSQVEEAFYFKVFETVLPILQTASRGWVKEERAESKKKAEAAAAQRRKEEARRQVRRKRRAQSVSEEVILDETGEEWQSDNGGESEAGIDSKEQSAAQESTGYTQEGSKVVPAATSGPNVVNLAIDSDTDMEVAAVESSKRGEKEDGEEGKKPSPGSVASYATLPLTGTLPLSPSEANRLKNPLLRLRQACVHPQMALRKDPTVKERLNRRNLRQHTNAAVMSLPEILDSMIKQQRVECEEHPREYVFYQHKLAGIAWILADELESNSGRSSDALERRIQHLEAAAAHYRKVQEVEEKYLPFEIRIDRFMRLHWRKNLAETLLMLKSLRAPQSGGGGEGGEGAPAVVFDTGHLFIDRLNEAANGIAAECAEERGVGVSKAVAKLGNCVA